MQIDEICALLAINSSLEIVEHVEEYIKGKTFLMGMENSLHSLCICFLSPVPPALVLLSLLNHDHRYHGHYQ